MERTLTFSVLSGWHFNTVSQNASHWRAITSKKKRWISTENKLGWSLIDSPSYQATGHSKFNFYSGKIVRCCFKDFEKCIIEIIVIRYCVELNLKRHDISNIYI